MTGHARSGGFDTIRLCAALLVYHSHSFALAGRPEPSVPGYSLGGVAVIVFFAISGYWVTQSALQRSFGAYAMARALRIFPGLAVSLVAVILACALASSIPVNDYLVQPATWRYLQNAFPFFLPALGEIPGVFEDGANHAVNGSLWTLRYEVMCYVALGLAALFGRMGVRLVMIAAALFGAGVLGMMIAAGSTAVGDHHIRLLDYLQVRWIATFGAAFAFGAWLHGFDDRRLALAIAGSAAALALTWRDPILAPAAGLFLFGSTAIWLGRKLHLDRRITRGHDLSYGVYIYAFPCQQLAVRLVEPVGAADFAVYYLTGLAGTVTLAGPPWWLI
ncbi:MAG: acyltransferase, partial [Phenylobacterium sp.]|nr:acyltransferase [Phenylobacterium sp.]